MLVLLLLLVPVGALLNVEELKFLHYDVSLDTGDPLVLPSTAPGEEEGEEESLVLSSGSGQPFRCRIPRAAALLGHSQAATDAAAATTLATPDVIGNLDAAFHGHSHCLSKTVGWWTYEFCYGENIKQYHLEGHQISGGSIILGYYATDKEWDQNAVASLLKSQKHRYHVQNFTGGSVCDLTYQLRRTEVQFYCDDELAPTEAYILDVEESVSCEYVLRIQVGSLCSLPLFRSLVKPRESTSLTCRPILTQDQFNRLQEVKQQEEEERKKVQALRLQIQQVKEQEMRNQKKLAEEEKKMEEEQMEKYYISELLTTHTNLAEVIVDTYFQYWNEWYADSNEGYDGELIEAGLELKGYEWAYGAGVDSSIWQWPPDVIDHWLRVRFRRRPDAWLTFRRVFRRYFFQHSGFFHIKWPTKSMTTDPDTFIRSVLVRALQLIRDDPETYPPQPDAHHFANVFNILFSSHGLSLKELENDLYTEEEINERELLYEVHGEKRVEEMDAINKQVFDTEWRNEELAEKVVRRINSPETFEGDLSESFADLFEELTSEAEAEMEAAGELDAGVRAERQPAFKALADTLNKILNKVEAVERSVVKTPAEPDVLEDTPSKAESVGKTNPFVEDVPPKSGRVSVKGRKEEGSVEGVKVEALEVSEGEELEDAVERKTREIQNQLQKQLQDAGIDTKGRKVEVKVVTAGIWKDEAGKSSLHIINGDDSKELSSLLMSILGGDTPESKEEKRYSSLENGYQFDVKKVIKSVKASEPDDES